MVRPGCEVKLSDFYWLFRAVNDLITEWHMHTVFCYNYDNNSIIVDIILQVKICGWYSQPVSVAL